MIPSGLTDNNIEFFAKDGELYSLQDGTRYRYPELPESHIDFLSNMLMDDTSAQDTMTGIPVANRIKIYGICRFGGCNFTPDASDEGDCIDMHEYYECGIRGVCPFEGKRCKDIVMPAGVLTSHMLKMMLLVTAGLINKEIADKLSIAKKTVDNTLVTITSRIGGRNRADIVRFVKERGIS